MNSSSRSSNTGLIAGIIIVSIALFGGLIFLLVRLPSESGIVRNETVAFNDANDPSIGPADAKVTVHMYEDYECPACQAANPPLAQTIEAYKDRVRFVWKDFPLESIHPAARPSANAARCAQDQGKFWEYHDQLFALRGWVTNKDRISAFTALAKNIAGLNQDQFATCLSSKAKDGLVAANIREALANNVSATPTFFVNQTRQFAMSAPDWKQTLDAALAAAEGASTTTTSQ